MKSQFLLGIPIYNTTLQQFVNILDDCIQHSEKKTIFGISAAAYGRLKYRKDLYGIYKKFDIIVAEGAGIPFLAKLFGVTIKEKIGMVNLMYSLLELSNRKKYKVLLFGATEETNKKAELEILRQYPNVNIAKGINGFFLEENIDGIIKRINNEKPDILFIGISYPIKERFAIKYKHSLNSTLIIPCGGAFEVLAGNIKKPKIHFKRFPIAWVFRLVQEPKRMFKDIFLTVFYTVIFVIPQLYIKHITRIERNPDIGKFFKIEKNLWDPNSDSILP